MILRPGLWGWGSAGVGNFVSELMTFGDEFGEAFSSSNSNWRSFRRSMRLFKNMD